MKRGRKPFKQWNEELQLWISSKELNRIVFKQSDYQLLEKTYYDNGKWIIYWELEKLSNSYKYDGKLYKEYSGVKSFYQDQGWSNESTEVYSQELIDQNI